MPHLRNRHFSALAKHTASYSPLIGVLGHRQVGKTTFLEKWVNHYLTFDDEDTLVHAKNNPKAFLQTLPALNSAIDECQLCEPLFPALKERVRKNKAPGQIYLSGSVRFTSKKLIKESLTGRISTLELLPMTLSELYGSELPDLAIQLTRVPSLNDWNPVPLSKGVYTSRTKFLTKYLECGGLPGVCFLRTPPLRNKKLRDQIETILDRDLRQIIQTPLLLRDLIGFVRALALHDGTSFSWQGIRRQTRISPITQKKLLYALEATFVIRTLQIEGDYNGFAIFFEDQAEAQMLAQNQIPPDRQWAGLIYRNLREQFFYRPDVGYDFFQYKTRAGVNVPFAVRTPNCTVGFIPVQGQVERSHRAAADSFLKHYSQSICILVTDQNETGKYNERCGLIPAAGLLF